MAAPAPLPRALALCAMTQAISASAARQNAASAWGEDCVESIFTGVVWVAKEPERVSLGALRPRTIIFEERQVRKRDAYGYGKEAFTYTCAYSATEEEDGGRNAQNDSGIARLWDWSFYSNVLCCLEARLAGIQPYLFCKTGQGDLRQIRVGGSPFGKPDFENEAMRFTREEL